MSYVYLIGGFILLGMGGEAVVRGAVDLSARLGVSKLFIGLFIVAFGTSLPEMVVAVDAVLAGKADIAVGNVIGSNIANLLLVLGLGGLLYPIACNRDVVNRDVVVMLAVTGFFIWLAHRGEIGELQGLFMMGTLLVYLTYALFTESIKKHPVGTLEYNIDIQDEFGPSNSKLGPFVDLAVLALGLGALVFGADIMVTGASDIASMLGFSEAIIGLTIVAVGTSLPEIATMVIAALRKHPEVAVGGVIGSNIFNLLAVLGVAGWFAPVPINADFLDIDMWVMLGAALIVVPFMTTGWRISRIEGLILFSAYMAYVAIAYDYPLLDYLPMEIPLIGGESAAQ